MPAEPLRHRIRLRGPWTRDPGYPVCYRRQFNCPTGLTADTELFLLFQGCDDLASVELNETSLQLERLDKHLQQARIARLNPGANRLKLQLHADDEGDSRLNGEVCLEIVESA